MKKYYAEVAQWGRDKTTVVQFDSQQDRNDFCERDYTNKVSSQEAKERGFIHISELE